MPEYYYLNPKHIKLVEKDVLVDTPFGKISPAFAQMIGITLIEDTRTGKMSYIYKKSDMNHGVLTDIKEDE